MTKRDSLLDRLPCGWTRSYCFSCGDILACGIDEITETRGLLTCRVCFSGIPSLTPVGVGGFQLPLDPHNEAMKDEGARLAFECLEECFSTEPDVLWPLYLAFARIILMIESLFGHSGMSNLEALAQKVAMEHRGARRDVLAAIARRRHIDVD